MGRLPVLKPGEVVKILKKAGFVEKRQAGSHLQMWHPTKDLRATVPMHNRDLKRKTLKSIFLQAKLGEGDF